MARLLVSDIMTTHVVTLFEEGSLPLAEDMMRYRRIRHLPVVDEANRLVGIVTHRDILRMAMSRLGTKPTLGERALEDHVPVRDLLTRDVWTIAPHALASAAATLLKDHRFGCLPVVDDARHVVGIVTEADFLRIAEEELLRRDDAPA